MIFSKNGTKLLSFLGEICVKNKIAKIIFGLMAILLVTAISTILIYYYFTDLEQENKEYLLNSVLPFLIIPLIAIVLPVFIYFYEQFPVALETELKNLRAERVIITKKLEKDKELDIFHTIQLSLNQLNEYYSINKDQARSSFKFSIFSIVIGLITIITGIWLYYLDIKNIEISYISTISGIISEFIGGAYFFMYKKSSEQVNFFFGQLIKIQDTMLSINLADNINDKTKKVEIHEKIIISLLERSLK